MECETEEYISVFMYWPDIFLPFSSIRWRVHQFLRLLFQLASTSCIIFVSKHAVRMCNYVISSELSKRMFKTLEFVTPGLLHSIFLHLTPISDRYSCDFAYWLYPSLIVKMLKIEFSPKALQRFF